MLEWLEHIDVPPRLVATKTDKVRPSKSQARRRDLVAKLDVDKSEVLWVSSESRPGYLRAPYRDPRVLPRRLSNPASAVAEATRWW